MRRTAPKWLILLSGLSLLASTASLSACKDDDAPKGGEASSASEGEPAAGSKAAPEDDEGEGEADEPADERLAEGEDEDPIEESTESETDAPADDARARARAAIARTRPGAEETAEAGAIDGGDAPPEAGDADGDEGAARTPGAAARPRSTRPLGAGEDADKATAAGAPVEPAEDDLTTEDDDLAGLDPVARRKAERERRIAELKRRNEERRQERLSRLAERGGEGADVPPGGAVNGLDPRALLRTGEGDGDGADGAAEDAGAEAGAPEPAEPRVVVAAPKAPPALDLSRYLSLTEVRKATGDTTLMEDGQLTGMPASEMYNSRYFAPPQRANFGASFQLWRDRTRRDANERFRRLRKEYPNAEDTISPAPKSFFSYWGDVMYLVFADLTKRIVVAVSCSADICTPDELLALAESIKAKL